MLTSTLIRILLAAALLGGSAPAFAGTKYVGPHGNPVTALPPATVTRFVIGVMGGAGKHVPDRVNVALNELGDEIGKSGHVTLTGACPGFPQVVQLAAKKAGGLTIGISGFRTRAKHVAHGAPTEGFDVMQFTSLPHAQRGQGDRPNYMGRDIDNIARSNGVVIVGGRSGTLNEAMVAYDEGRPIAVLKGSGGVADEFEHLVGVIKKAGKPPRAPIIFDSDPRRLVKRLLKVLDAPKEGASHWEG